MVLYQLSILRLAGQVTHLHFSGNYADLINSCSLSVVYRWIRNCFRIILGSKNQNCTVGPIFQCHLSSSMWINQGRPLQPEKLVLFSTPLSTPKNFHQKSSQPLVWYMVEFVLMSPFRKYIVWYTLIHIWGHQDQKTEVLFFTGTS